VQTQLSRLTRKESFDNFTFKWRYMELREYLFRERLTVTAFAKQLGVSRNHINKIVNGHGRPGVALARLIEHETQGKVTAQEMLQHEKKEKE
jgi:transcriptional regulator with XRE-family HTH domain